MGKILKTKEEKEKQKVSKQKGAEVKTTAKKSDVSVKKISLIGKIFRGSEIIVERDIVINGVKMKEINNSNEVVYLDQDELDALIK